VAPDILNLCSLQLQGGLCPLHEAIFSRQNTAVLESEAALPTALAHLTDNHEHEMLKTKVTSQLHD